MGADGGSVPKRDDLVKTKDAGGGGGGRAEEDAAAENAAQRQRWECCALTGDALREPVVADDLGHLINKASLVVALLAKTLPHTFSHISSLRDTLPLHLSRNPGPPATWVCPVTLNEAGRAPGPKGRMVAMRPCGCVLCEEALTNLRVGTGGAAQSVCPVCSKETDFARALKLNPTDQERAAMAEDSAQRKRAAAAAIASAGTRGKKKKVVKKKSAASADGVQSRKRASCDCRTSCSEECEELDAKKAKGPPPPPPNASVPHKK